MEPIILGTLINEELAIPEEMCGRTIGIPGLAIEKVHKVMACSQQ